MASTKAVTLVLSGGNSLGAFEAGAYETLHNASIRPEWVIGVSIGAVNGAIIAGNLEKRRVSALREFWSDAAWPGMEWGSGLGLRGQELERWLGQYQTGLLGCPAIFVPNYSAVFARRPTEIGLFRLAPLRRTLERLVDFDLLNSGRVRFTTMAVDVETSEEVVFETGKHRIGPEHILASGALLPDFCPIEIGGRLLGDGGLMANLPIDIARRDAANDGVCIAVDLFSAKGLQPATLGEAIMRRQELLFASQTRLMLEAGERERRLRDKLRAVLELLPSAANEAAPARAAFDEARKPELRIIRLAWQPGYEPGLRGYDYSKRALATRWEAGARSASDGLAQLDLSRDEPSVATQFARAVA